MKNSFMYKISKLVPLFFILLGLGSVAFGQESNQQSNKKPEKKYKNVIRYNLSGALLFGVNRYVVFGYERVVSPHQSFSINMGPVGLPKFISINTDSFALSKDVKNTGFNISGDYRFYLPKENKYDAPHGLYIGPYASYNHFHRETDWNYQQSGSNQQVVNTSTDLGIVTFGGELGYQFVLWKRVALDLVLVGPGLSFYTLKAEIQNTLSDANKKQLQQALEQLLTQKFPGMNYVFSGKTFDANGTIRTGSIGYRYIVHIGFVF